MAKKKIKNYRGQDTAQYQTVNNDDPQTIQSDKHLADINQILKDFANTGLEHLDNVDMQFKDVSEIGDYHDVMLEVRKAEETFMELPSKVREIFGHSVEHWLDTAHDKDKRDALVKAGFIKGVEEVVSPSETGGGTGDPTTPQGDGGEMGA